MRCGESSRLSARSIYSSRMWIIGILMIWILVAFVIYQNERRPNGKDPRGDTEPWTRQTGKWDYYRISWFPSKLVVLISKLFSTIILINRFVEAIFINLCFFFFSSFLIIDIKQLAYLEIRKRVGIIVWYLFIYFSSNVFLFSLNKRKYNHIIYQNFLKSW